MAERNTAQGMMDELNNADWMVATLETGLRLDISSSDQKWKCWKRREFLSQYSGQADSS